MKDYKEYWEESCSNALKEAGITFNQAQLNTVSVMLMLSQKYYEKIFDFTLTDRPDKTQFETDLEKLVQEILEQDPSIPKTVPCKACYGMGIVQDGWGRDTNCYNCGGKGRHKPVMSV